MPLGVVGSIGAQWDNSIGGTTVTTASLDTTGAVLLVATISQRHGTFDPTAPISDSKGNTWISAVAYGTNDAIYYAKNAIVGAGHTFTVTLSVGGWPAIAVTAVSGADTSSPLDQTAQNDDGGNTTTHSSPSVTTSQADEILIGALEFSTQSGGGISATGSYTMAVNQDGSATAVAMAQAYRIVSATGSYTSSFSTGNSVWAANLLATFKAAGGGSTVTWVGYIG